MKKRYILVALIFFLMFIGNVNAKIGDLIYEITKLNMQDTENGVKITFEGWAFIHLTNNFRGNFITTDKLERGYKGAPDYEGGHEIMIVVEDESGNKAYLKNKLYDGYSGSTAEKLKKYNFYYMQFYDKANANIENEYYTNYNHLSGWKNANSCGIDTTSQCIYEDIGFHIEFFAENLSSDKNYTFKLYATNTDYDIKYKTFPGVSSGTDGRKGKLGVLDYEGKKWAGSEIYFYDDVLTNSVTINKAELIGKSSSKDDVFVTVHDGMPRVCSNGINNCKTIGFKIENTIFKLGGDKRIEDTDCNKEYKCGPGDYVIKTNGNGTYPSDERFTRIYRSWAVPAGETTLQIKIETKNDKKCEVSEPSGSKDMSCNGWTNLSSICDELTVKEGNSSAVVKITQNGYISNIFKSNLVNDDTDYNANSYNGGWFQYAIVYRNEVSFTTKNLSGNINDINIAMERKIKNFDKFKEEISLDITGLENITGTKLIKKCTQSGNFKNDNTLVTTCTFFLPSSLIDELGKVKYKDDESEASVSNKYYIDLDISKYEVSVTLENLSILSDKQAKTDSKDKKVWFGTWTVKNRCNLKVTDRLIETDGDSSKDGKTKYKFIYRPIDLKDPFPSRFPGVNWDRWYIDDKNKDKKTLEDSYKKLNYYTILDNKTISEIKKYNNNHDYFGSVDEEFFKEYIKEGGS